MFDIHVCKCIDEQCKCKVSTIKKASSTHFHWSILAVYIYGHLTNTVLTMQNSDGAKR